MPETFPPNSQNDLANTKLTDRELLIHAVQHLEDLSEQVTDLHDQLELFAPLLAKYAPKGKPDMIALMQARREGKRR